MNTTEPRSLTSETCELQLASAEQLIWQLLDNSLSEQGVQELETLCREIPTVKELLVSCVMLHTDLAQFFGEPCQLDFAALRSAAESQ